LIAVYVAIMAAKLGRIERELHELNELADRRPAAPAHDVAAPVHDANAPAHDAPAVDVPPPTRAQEPVG
jgi:hypothetical protein